LAEVFMTDRSRRLLGGAVHVRSAGIAAGRYLSPETIETAKEKGFDAGSLSPTQLTANMLREADLVVTMTRDHTAEVLDVAPEVAERTFTLKELTGLLASLPVSEPSLERESVMARIAELHRQRASGAVTTTYDDVRDPLGLPMEVYRDVAAEIEAGVDDLVRGLFGVRDRAEAAPGGS
jgi:low molecular weight protein-tyrosine phosphatase